MGTSVPPQPTIPPMPSIKNKWIFEKFKGDGAIYGICPKCNFRKSMGGLDFKTNEYEIKNQYHYCPMCGEYLYDGSDELNVKWNERDITDLLEMSIQKKNI
jgi:excinuclease UvrABC ATPase subunit